MIAKQSLLDTLAHDNESTCYVWLQKLKQFRGYYQDNDVSNHDRDLAHSKEIFLQDTVLWLMITVPSNKV